MYEEVGDGVVVAADPAEYRWSGGPSPWGFSGTWFGFPDDAEGPTSSMVYMDDKAGPWRTGEDAFWKALYWPDEDRFLLWFPNPDTGSPHHQHMRDRYVKERLGPDDRREIGNPEELMGSGASEFSAAKAHLPGTGNSRVENVAWVSTWPGAPSMDEISKMSNEELAAEAEKIRLDLDQHLRKFRREMRDVMELYKDRAFFDPDQPRDLEGRWVRVKVPGVPGTIAVDPADLPEYDPLSKVLNTILDSDWAEIHLDLEKIAERWWAQWLALRRDLYQHPIRTLSNPGQAGSPAWEENVGRKPTAMDTLYFDPNQPRDWRGRWVRIPGLNRLGEYRIEHTAPGPGGGARADDLNNPTTAVFPDDIYDKKTQLRYYGTGDDEADRESFKVVNSVRGQPAAVIPVYRAVPGDVDEINSGDWVTMSYSYAWLNAEQLSPDENAKIITKMVPARELWTDGNSINEWGWHEGSGRPVETDDVGFYPEAEGPVEEDEIERAIRGAIDSAHGLEPDDEGGVFIPDIQAAIQGEQAQAIAQQVIASEAAGEEIPVELYSMIDQRIEELVWEMRQRTAWLSEGPPEWTHERFDGLPDVPDVMVSLSQMPRESDVEIRQALTDALERYPELRGHLARVVQMSEAPPDIKREYAYTIAGGSELFGIAVHEPSDGTTSIYIDDRPVVGEVFATQTEAGLLSRSSDSSYGRAMHEIAHAKHNYEFGPAAAAFNLNRQKMIEDWTNDMVAALTDAGLFRWDDPEVAKKATTEGMMAYPGVEDDPELEGESRLREVTYYESDPLELYAEMFAIFNTPGALEKYPPGIQAMLQEWRRSFNERRGKRPYRREAFNAMRDTGASV